MKTGVLITMCMIGVVMIVDPSALASDSTVSQVTIVALLVAMCPPLFKGLVYIFIKQSQGSKMHYIKMSFWYSAFGMTVLTVFMGGSVTILCFAGQPYDWVIRSVDVTECIYLFAISFLGFIAQISMTKATQIINATVASLIRNGDIIFTILFQVLYFNDIPSAIQVGGIIFMVLSTVGVIIVKERAQLEAAKNPGGAKPEEVGETMMARKRLF